MTITETGIKDLLIIEPKVFEDNRGYFFESYNQQIFEENNITCNFIQDNESFSSYGVVRGLHYQLNPHAQTKLMRVVLGKILDVAVDIRKNSKTFGKHFSIELSAENKKQLLIPKGFAHGFSVLSKTVIVNYKCDALYNKDAESGIYFADKNINIDWKIDEKDMILSEKDKKWSWLKDANLNF